MLSSAPQALTCPPSPTTPLSSTTSDPAVPEAIYPDADAACIVVAAHDLLRHLERGERLDAAILRAAMVQAYGASDASGAWDWKLAYEATEAATVLFLRRYGSALLRRAGTAEAMLPLLARIAALLPTQTRRSEEAPPCSSSQRRSKLGWAAVAAAGVRPGDVVLEPSAGTGLLAILAELSGGALVLNELADIRAGLLARLFPSIPVTRCDAAQIDDHLPPEIRPSVIVMTRLLGDGACGGPCAVRRLAAPPLCACAAGAGWTAGRHDGCRLRARRAGVAQRLRATAEPSPRRVHGGNRRRGLSPATAPPSRPASQ